LVVHNYGHGGSGWSLSWGSANLAIQKALVNSQPGGGDRLRCDRTDVGDQWRQRAGAAVTIYARDLLSSDPLQPRHWKLDAGFAHFAT